MGRQPSPILRVLIFFLLFFPAILLLPDFSWALHLYTDSKNGGNPKLAQRTYNVYIQANPANPNWRDEVIAALDKWRAELGPRGIDLQLQAGDPPQTPLDLDAYNAEVAQYNADPNPDPANYPEMAKYQAKENSISVYWDTTANIQKMGENDIGGARAASYWNFDQNGKAETTEISDIFLPTDPKGATDEIKTVQIHNLSMHEFAHPAGFDHYTKNQDGEVMKADATLFDTRITIQPEDIKGLNAIYGAKPEVNIVPNAEQKAVSDLTDEIQDELPVGLESIWEYTYELTWLDGEIVSYFQVETGCAEIYLALGLDGVSDWLIDLPEADERYLEFYADSYYLPEISSTGRFALYSPTAPGLGWLVTSGTAILGAVPVPEPATWQLFAAITMVMLLAVRRSTMTTSATAAQFIRAFVCILLTGGIGISQAHATQVTATWTGTTGDWTDAYWSFAPASTEPYPDNSASEFFQVRIDDEAATASVVTLASEVQIDRLEISENDYLTLTGGQLTFARDDLRPGSGEAIVDQGTIAGSGYLGGAGPGSGIMLLNNRKGTIVANGGDLVVDPSGGDGSTVVSMQNSGTFASWGLGSTLLLKNSLIEQSKSGSIETFVGGNVILEDTAVHGGSVRVEACLPPLLCGELQLNRGAITEGTRVTIEENAIARVLASAFPGGTLPAKMKIQGGSVFVEAGPLNPVVLTLDAGAGAADAIDFSNPGNPANPGRIITNLPSGLPIEGTSIIRIIDGNVDLVNPLWPGEGTPRGGIFLNGATPAAARIVADTNDRLLTVNKGTIITTMPGRNGSIGGVPIGGEAAPIVVVKGDATGRGMVAANIGGRLEIADLRNEGGKVQALNGGTLALGNNAFPNAGEVRIFSGGTLKLAGNYLQLAETTLIEGVADIGGRYIQTGGMTTVATGGELRSQEVHLQDGRFTGDILSNFILDGNWDLVISDLLDFDHIEVFNNPLTEAVEGMATILAGSSIWIDLLFDAQLGDIFNILMADMIDVDLDLLSISDPFADQRYFRASVIDIFDPVLGRDREALQLEVVVPEPSTWWLFLLGFSFMAGALFRQSQKSEDRL
ncbi:MAG: PEP-CTERM sorting domain-containing protein [Desulfuromonadaceae bacterium]